MKNIEAVIPALNVHRTIDDLRKLDVANVVVETVKVYDRETHPTMVYRGCQYEQEFTTAAKLRFQVPDDGSSQAEAILARAAQD